MKIIEKLRRWVGASPRSGELDESDLLARREGKRIEFDEGTAKWGPPAGQPLPDFDADQEKPRY